jgi:hypothetical protein
VYELCARGIDGDQDGGTGRMMLKPWSVDRLSDQASLRLRSAGGAIRVVNLVSESRRRIL